MKLYMVNFQDSQDLVTISARNNQEARKEFNRMVSIKQLDANYTEGEKNE